MGEVVHTITCLCKLLDNLISVVLKPNFFRLSKLNRLSSEEILTFWTVLHRLCCFSTTHICEDDAKKCISRYLMKHGGVIAYSLPPDSTARQLLLCFGWLLSQGILETIIDQLVIETPLGKEFLFEPKKPDNFAGPIRLGQDNPDTMRQYAIFLTGRIHHNLRAIANFRQEKAELCAKIHEATAGFQGLSHLSVSDVQLLTHPELLPDFLTRCRPCLRSLEAYYRWKKKCHVFWQWMASVLKEEESSYVKQSLSETGLEHLTVFLKNLEDNVRSAVMSENQEPLREDTLGFITRRLCVSKNSEVLDSVIEVLDSKIEALKICNERKKQELEKKLSSNEKLSDKSGDVYNILNSFSLPIEKRFSSKNVKSTMTMPLSSNSSGQLNNI